MKKLLFTVAVLFVFTCLGGGTAAAQELGQFNWNLAPFCDCFRVNVDKKGGGIYALNGVSDSCGGATYAALDGTAVTNPDGSIEIALNFVNGTFVSHIAATIARSTGYSGTWLDDLGGSGDFNFKCNFALRTGEAATSYGDSAD